MARVGKCSCTECDLVLPEDDVTAIACSLCEEWMHRTCFLKTTDISETMKTRKGMFVMSIIFPWISLGSSMHLCSLTGS